MKLIDIHTHIIPYSEVSGYRRSGTAQDLVTWMDTAGIAKAVVHPLESPESDSEYSISAQVWDICAEFPDRLIPFACADPRAQRALDKVRHYHARGAKGFGEHKCGLSVDDPLSLRLYRLCGELQLPILFHVDPEINSDDVGLPRLRRVLREVPETVFIAHGPGWWTAVSGDDDRSGGYPKGPVKPGGAVHEVLSEFPNLYADISAGSGYNALTRDPTFTEGFLSRHWRKLIFGSDYFMVGQETPQLDWLRTYPMPEEWQNAIGGGNAQRLLGLQDEQ